MERITSPSPARPIRTLGMEFVEGFKITDAAMLDLYAVDRAALLKRVVQVYAHQMLVEGFFNADPHAGNLMVNVCDERDEAALVLLDFGMCVNLPERVRSCLPLPHLFQRQRSELVSKWICQTRLNPSSITNRRALTGKRAKNVD